MKTFITFILGIALLSSCDVYVLEQRVDHRDRIVGNYEMDEYSETYRDYTYYDMEVSKSAYSHREIYMHNFYGVNIRIYAYVDGNAVTIPYQINNGYEIEGHGTVYRNELRLNYRVVDVYHGTATDFCDTQARRFRY